MKKCYKKLKRIIAFSLAVLILATSVPYHPTVKAASDDYPEEIYFPINVLDFRADNMLFEYINYDSPLTLHQNLYGKGNGKGYIEDELDPVTGTPVYKRETVEKIAEFVQADLGKTGDVLDKVDRDWVNSGQGNYNPLSLKDLIEQTPPPPMETIVVMDKSTYDKLPSGAGNGSAVNANLVDWKTSYTGAYWVRYIDNHQPNGQWGRNVGSGKVISQYIRPGVGNGYVDLYMVHSDGSITLLSNEPVYKTMSGLTPGNYGFQHMDFKVYGDWDNGIGWWLLHMDANNKQQVYYPNGFAGRNQEYMTIGQDGILTYTLSLKDQNVPAEDWVFDGRTWVANIRYETYFTGNYVLGDYDESKKKFDEVDADGNLVNGWRDIKTCMDYAYFVTKNFFIYNPTLNTQYNDYSYLIFHRLQEKKEGEDDDVGKVAYEFAADKNHPGMNIIYNKDSKTIRNVFGDDTGDETAGDVVKSGGSMFICDGMYGPNEENNPFKDIDVLRRDDDHGGGTDHNFHFTVSSKSKFVYKEAGEQYFYFSGDDDVFVFVNNHLLVDLGGAKEQMDDSIYLPDLAAVPKEFTDQEKNEDENGNPKVDKDGNPLYERAVDENGTPKVDKNGDPLWYKWLLDESGRLKYREVTKKDENGNPVQAKDENGNLKFEQAVDDEGDPMYDENGDPVMDPVWEIVKEPAYVSKYGLVEGEEVDFAFFYMERHTIASNFYGKMNFKLATDKLDNDFGYSVIPYGYMAPLNYTFSSRRELTTNENFIFSDSFGNRFGVEVVRKKNGDIDKDKSKGVFQLGPGVSVRKNTMELKVLDADGNEDGTRSLTIENPDEKKMKDAFLGLKLSKGETIQLSGLQYDTSTLAYDDYDKLTDTMRKLSYNVEANYEAWQVGAQSPTKGNADFTGSVNVIVGSMIIRTDEESVRRQLADFKPLTVTRYADGTEMCENADDYAFGALNDLLDGYVCYDSATQNSAVTASGARKVAVEVSDDGTYAEMTKLMEGYFTLKMDPEADIFKNYDISMSVKVNGTEYDLNSLKDAAGNLTDAKIEDPWVDIKYSIADKALTVKYKPEYDKEEEIWEYPEVELILKANRPFPDLKDLT